MSRRAVSGALLGLTAVLEGFAAVRRFQARNEQFAAAQRRAVALGRTLVVVGDPDAGLHTRLARAYPCGDVCVDINGCPACPMQVVADLTRDRLPFTDDSVVVFVACVLEYVADLRPAMEELMRVAGPDNLFIVTVQPWTITAALYPGATWRDVSREHHAFAMKRVSSVRKVMYAGTLAALLAGTIIPER
jgi:SAM-dependent methyltransferase